MNEEKRLDDETLEEVAGGAPGGSTEGMDRQMFYMGNCFRCRLKNTPACHYYGNLHQAAQESGTTCPYKEV